MKILATISISMALTLAAFGVGAQTVYRCGNAYSGEPCPQAKLIDAADARTEAQRADALRVSADTKRLAREMQADRLALQASQRPAGAASLGGAPTKLALSEPRAPKKPKKGKKPAPKAPKAAKATKATA